MANAPSGIERVERRNYMLGGAGVIVAALTQPRSIALGFAVGVALTCLNFFVLRKLVVKWTSDAAAGRAGNAPLLMLPKMILLMGAVVAALALLPINAPAFAAGYSIFILSIMIEAVLAAFRPSPAPDPSPPTENTEHTHG